MTKKTPDTLRDSAPSAVDATSAHEDLGFGPPPPADYSPAQRQAFIETFGRVSKVEVERFERRRRLGEAQDELDGQKEAVDLCKANVSVCDAQLEKLYEHLKAIHKGTWEQALPGMDGQGQGGTGTDSEEIPAELLTLALDHVASAERKGKGIDANGLSMALFGSRKKENRPRCDAILARLVAEGAIVADENAEEGKPKYLPAGKE